MPWFLALPRSRPKLNYGAGRDFGVGPEFGATQKQLIITGNSWACCVPVKKIGSRDSIFGLVNSTYLLKITNHNQHASNINYLANLIQKYWTCFRYQKLADFLVCSFTEACKNLVSKASKAFFKLTQLNVKEKVPVALKLFDSLVTPILSYASEVWGPTYLKKTWQSWLPSPMWYTCCRKT